MAAEAYELVVTWRGDTWRDFPPPVVGTLPDPVPEAPLARAGWFRAGVRDRVAAALTDTPQSAAQLARALGAEYRSVWRALKVLAATGVAVEVNVEGAERAARPSGTVVFLYRRAVERQERAA